ncbi:phage tail spike protein [Salipaludibacillus sp. CF4.18]|uniref:phage tail spike protein n=1 Tax=Salipaludibacillus sp. CF4.18 TaxID=3373081 RepID=UPI003EE53F64
MPNIHILDHQTDTIVDYYSNKSKLFWDDVHVLDLESYLETFDFTTTYDQSEHLKSRNRVLIKDEDGFYRELIINNTIKYKDDKEVYAKASYLDLKKSKVINPKTLEGATVNTATDNVLIGTEWQRGYMEYAGIRSITFENYTNPFSALKKIAREFGLELRFRVETDGNKIIGRFVDLIPIRRVFNGKEITVGKDLIGVKRSETSDEIVTALRCIGPEQDDGLRLIVDVKDEDARQRWSRNNNHLWDVYEPTSEDEDMTASRLESLGQAELAKRVNTVVEYEADQVSIEDVFGLEHEKVRFGDTVRIKDTSYSPALYLEARVKKIQRSISDTSQKTFVLGDYIEFEEEDLRELFNSLRKALALKITEQQLLDRTYDKVEIDSKDTSVFDDSTIFTEQYAEKKRIESNLPPDDTSVIWIDTTDSDNIIWKTWNGLEWVSGPSGPQGIEGPQGPEGQSLFTWVKYADDSSGNGMTQLPDGKSHIGFAYNKTTDIESDIASDYTWSKIEGPQGTVGDDGITYYTWLKYADTPTSGMSDDPTGKEYMGVAYNKTTSTESTTYGDYVWSLIKGDKGESGEIFTHLEFEEVGDYVDYPSSTSPSTSITMEAWVRLDLHSSNAVRFIGGRGNTSGKGYWLGVKSDGTVTFALQHQLSSNITINLGEWIHVAGAWDGTTQRVYINGEFRGDISTSILSIDYTDIGTLKVGNIEGLSSTRCWDGGISDVRVWDVARTQEEIQSNMNTELVGTETGLVGYWKLDDGAGDVVKDSVGTNNGNIIGASWVGPITYSWIKYADTPTSGMSDSPTGKDYMGVAYNKFTTVESTMYSDYSWTLVKGEKGDQGFPGDPGEDGSPSYTHIAYATSSDGSTGFSTSDSTNKTYVGMYVDSISTDSTDPAMYNWSLIKGSKGDQGIPGDTGENGETSYFHLAYATNSTGTSGFSTTDSTNKTYIGQYTDFISADSTDPASYKWTLIKGSKGDKGDTGSTGETGPQGPAGELNLVNNPNATDTLDWSGTSLVSRLFGDGKTIKQVQSYSSGNAQHFSSRFDVDTSKMYEVTMWLQADVTTGLVYLGHYAYNSSGSTIGSYSIPKGSGAKGAENSNPYGVSGYGPTTTWRKHTFYILPAGMDISDTNLTRNLGENNNYNFQFTGNTKQLLIRFLNWSNSSTAPKTVWNALPVVKEVDISVLEANKSKNIQDLWRHADTLEIDGANLRANTVTATHIIAASISTEHIKSLNGLDIGNGQFKVDANGNVSFAGNLSGASGTFSGKLLSQSVKIESPTISSSNLVALDIMRLGFNPLVHAGYFRFKQESGIDNQLNFTTETGGSAILAIPGGILDSQAVIADAVYGDSIEITRLGHDHGTIRLNSSDVLVINKWIQTTGVTSASGNLMLRDYGNGNVGISASSGTLFLGLINTSLIDLSAPIKTNYSMEFSGGSTASGEITFDDRIRVRSKKGNHNGSMIINPATDEVSFYQNGAFRHSFYPNGTKSGGSIEIDGENLGMSPIDSPQVLLEYIEFDMPIDVAGTKIYLDATYLKTVVKFAAFPNNGKVVEKGANFIIIEGEGVADIRFVGERIGHEGAFYADMNDYENLEGEVV